MERVHKASRPRQDLTSLFISGQVQWIHTVIGVSIVANLRRNENRIADRLDSVLGRSGHFWSRSSVHKTHSDGTATLHSLWIRNTFYSWLAREFSRKLTSSGAVYICSVHLEWLARRTWPYGAYLHVWWTKDWTAFVIWQAPIFSQTTLHDL